MTDAAHATTQANQPAEVQTGDWGKLFVTQRCCGAATCRNYAPGLLGEEPHSLLARAVHVLLGKRRGARVLPRAVQRYVPEA